jgi:hypothetical protein
LLDAFHVQPVPEVTLTLTVPVAAEELSASVVGETAKTHGAGWVSVKVWPAMVTVAVRALVPVFAAAVNVTEAGPVPLAVPTVTQVAPVDAVQLHPDVAVSETVVGPPPAPPVAGPRVVG